MPTFCVRFSAVTAGSAERGLVLRSLAINAPIAFSAASAHAETVISQWNWNSTVSGSYNRPWTGTVLSGTVLGYGHSAPASPLSSIIVNGTPDDPGTVISSTTWNRSASVNPPLTSAANATMGVMFSAPTTGMAAGEAVKLSWSQTVGFRSSRYWQLLVSTSGTSGPFSVPTGGTGSSISQFVDGFTSGTAAISGTATVGVSSSGVIDFRTIDGNWINQSVTTSSTLTAPLPAGFVDGISYTLPTGLGYENNANFAFALVGFWDPSLSATSGTTGLVSSFAGTDSTNPTSGYNRVPGSGGGMRLDLMTVSAVPVPEPATWALLGGAAAAGGSVVWRRHRRRRAARA